MTDSGDPSEPRKKLPRAQSLKRTEPSHEPNPVDPQNPNKTVELETADLVSLGQAGSVEAAVVTKTREMRRENFVRPGEKVIVDLGDPNAPPNVFVDFGDITDTPPPDPAAPMPPPPRASSPVPVQRPSTPVGVPQQHKIVTPSAQPQRSPTPVVQRAPTPVVQAQRAPTPAPRASTPVAQRPSQPMAAEPSVIVDQQVRPPTPIPVSAPVGPPVRPTPIAVPAQASSTAEMRVPSKSGGMGLVVLVYLLSAAALAYSIYNRWFA